MDTSCELTDKAIWVLKGELQRDCGVVHIEFDVVAQQGVKGVQQEGVHVEVCIADIPVKIFISMNGGTRQENLLRDCELLSDLVRKGEYRYAKYRDCLKMYNSIFGNNILLVTDKNFTTVGDGVMSLSLVKDQHVTLTGNCMKITMKIEVAWRTEDNKICFAQTVEHPIRVDTSKLAPVVELKSADDLEQIQLCWTRFVADKLRDVNRRLDLSYYHATSDMFDCGRSEFTNLISLELPRHFRLTAAQFFGDKLGSSKMSFSDFNFGVVTVEHLDEERLTEFAVTISDGKVKFCFLVKESSIMSVE
eukprot:GHVS01002377.1.p1 GENE.GHVS01002377.1~~GHVS01002377.1.p1  ORF type:complete len:305 (+),score=18.86 GHVS01002377.1:353-1267(+)